MKTDGALKATVSVEKDEAGRGSTLTISLPSGVTENH